MGLRTVSCKDWICVMIHVIFSWGFLGDRCSGARVPGSGDLVSEVPQIGIQRYGVPPKISRFAKLTMVPIGQYVSFACHVTGYPIPSIQWRHNRKVIAPSEKVVLNYYLQDNDTSSVILWIRKLTVEDLGEYHCEARNQYGSDQQTITLYGLPSAYLTEDSVVIKASVQRSSACPVETSWRALSMVVICWVRLCQRWFLQTG